MIVVRVELHSAITGHCTELARMLISNVGGTATKGDYKIETLRGRDKKALDLRNVMHTGEVKNHSRLALHVWHLVAKALKSVKYGEI